MKKIVFIDVDGFALVQFRAPLLQRLCKAGLEVVVCSGSFRENDQAHLEKIGCRVVQISLQRTGVDPREDRKTRRHLHDFLRRERPDAVVARAAKAVAYALPEAKKLGIQIRVGFMTGLGAMFHPSTNWERVIGIIGRRVILRGLRSATQIWALNSDDRATLKRLNAASEGVTIELMDSDGIDTNRFTSSPLPDTPTFCFIGRMIPAKGVRVFLDAASEVRSRRSDIQFIVAGEPDQHRNTVKVDELRSLERSRIIQYAGFVEDLEGLMKKISCLVLPSFHEGRPRTVIEALSSGRPVIVSDAVGCRDAIQDGHEGIVVPRGDHLKLAKAIEELADSRETMEKMARCARDTALTRYAEAIVVKRFMNQLMLEEQNSSLS